MEGDTTISTQKQISVTLYHLINSTVFNSSPIESKVIGGQTVKPGEMGFVVSLRINMSHIGGGCLVTDEVVLTAAQCTCNIIADGGNRFEYATVLIGSNDLSKGGIDIAIRKIEIHDKFCCSQPILTSDHDVALILVGILIVLNFQVEVINPSSDSGLPNSFSDNV